jgi:hypothetical protein
VFGDCTTCGWLYSTEPGEHIARYEITDATEESAFVFGEVYRRQRQVEGPRGRAGLGNGLAGWPPTSVSCVDEEPEAEPEPNRLPSARSASDRGTGGDSRSWSRKH